MKNKKIKKIIKLLRELGELEYKSESLTNFNKSNLTSFESKEWNFKLITIEIKNDLKQK